MESRNRIRAVSKVPGRGRRMRGLEARPEEVLTPSFPLPQGDSKAWVSFHSSLLLARFSSFGGGASGPGTSVTVIDEVIVAGLLGDGWRCIGDLNVFQV